MRDELLEAINRLYDVFDRYPRRAFEGCECCWGGPNSTPLPDEGESRGRVLVQPPGGTRPLRDLTAEELADVASEVPLTAGTFDTFRHYLPRIFEILAGEGFSWPDIDIAIGQIGYAKSGEGPWQSWPDDEQTAIRSFLQALWVDTLHKIDSDSYRVGDVLEAIGGAEPSLSWYLDEWLEFRSPEYATNLEQWLQVSLSDLRKSSGTDEIVRWVRSDRTLDAVRRASDRARTTTERESLDECYLRWLPSAVPG